MKKLARRSLRDAIENPPPPEKRHEPCVFCAEGASGDRGHPGVALGVGGIPTSNRSYVRLQCSFCGTVWVRRRLHRTVEWLRLAA